ncbi:MAG: hypothetical protein MUF54_15965, partial [Polyangiaceae bacterium]|nr:hypothetical protein [Polyangiaceae bacterium]
EERIRACSVTLPDIFADDGMLRPEERPAEQAVDEAAARNYVTRWLAAFAPDALEGMRVGLYAHSAVGKDLLHQVLRGLGAHVTRLADSDRFIPVDTEAIRPEDVQAAARWAVEHGLDAIVSTDGDGDRPLVSDEHGRWLRGDVAGILCARYLGADVVVTPVSSNTAVEACGWFRKVVRTRIGSPYVIEAMLGAAKGGGRVVGYEANGGFLTSTAIPLASGELSPLPTRDPVIVILSVLCASRERRLPISRLLGELPRRFTASDRLLNFPVERSRQAIAALQQGCAGCIDGAFEHRFGRAARVDTTDGLRVTFESGEVVHVRPSGNAPELRCYTEACSEARAVALKEEALELLARWR